MKDKPLYMVVHDEGDAPFLDIEHEYAESFQMAKASEITGQSIADLLDQDAENGNHHDFVGVHDALNVLLIQRMSAKAATRIMRDILNAGGLHGMRK